MPDLSEVIHREALNITRYAQFGTALFAKGAPSNGVSAKSLEEAKSSRIERDTTATDTAVAVRILRQILLVILLCIIELRHIHDLSRDPTTPRLAQRFRITFATCFGGGALCGVVDVDT